MRKIQCEDINGRKFSLLVDDDSIIIDQEWIDRQNINRAKAGRRPIVKWNVSSI